MNVAEIAGKAKLGLEELLKPGARVLYENIFSTRHIGRVLDFLLFEAREFIEKQPDPAYAEYRARQVIELGIFNGWSNFRKGEKTKCVEIELGWDDEKLVVAVAHYVDLDVKGFVPGGEEPSNDVASRMTKMYEQVQVISDGLIVRHEPLTGRVQAIAFLTGDANEKLVDATYVGVNASSFDVAEPRADASVPEQLAAADVEAFINDEKNDQSAGSDKLAASGLDDASTTISGVTNKIKDEAIKVAGAAEKKKDEAIVIKGSGPAPKEKDILRIKGGPAPKSQDETVTTIKSSTPAPAQAVSERTVIESVTDHLSPEATVAADVGNIADAVAGNADSPDENETNQSVQILVDTVKAEIVPLCPGLTDVQIQEAMSTLTQKIKDNYNQTLHHMLRVKNIQTISKVKHYKDQIALLSARIEELKNDNADLIESLAQKDSTEAEIHKLKASADPKAYKAKRDSEEVKVKETIQQYQASLEKDEVPSGAKEWGKGLMEATLKERALLTQRSREIEALLKKREYDFKNKENALKEEVRIKEEQARQKEYALAKTKESLANALLSLEQTRKVVESSGDKADVVHKLAAAEKLLATARDNNERMQKRVEDVQKKWQEEFNERSSLQQNASKQKKQIEDLTRKLADAEANKGDNNEIVMLTQTRDRSIKVIDDLKKQIKELQAKIAATVAANKPSAAGADLKKNAGGMGDAELKHKLDHANKLTAAMKEELERTKKRFDELKQSETKLRVEVAKLQADLKAAGKNPAPEKAPPKPVRSSTASPLIKPTAIKKPTGGTGGSTPPAGGTAPKK